MPHPHYSESPDAQLIELAERIIADQAARQAIPDDQDRNMDAATSRLGDLVEELTAMAPRTPAGLRAKARAAAAIAELDADGNFPDSSGKTDDLAYSVVADAARDLPG
jgi:hypothetical protein